MNLEQLKEIILLENLDKYLNFYIGGLKSEENSLSIEKTDNNRFNVRKTGERGMKREHVDLSEEAACNICLEYLRGAKLIYEYEKKKQTIKF